MNTVSAPDSRRFPLALAYLLALGNALFIGLSFSFVKVSVALAGPLDIMMFRFVLAFGLCHVYACFRGIRPRFGRENSLRLLPMGLCYPLGFFLFQGYGLLYATSGEAGILGATGPIFTAILAALFIRERYNPAQVLSILLSVAGVVYISVRKGASLDPENIAGIVLILLSAFSGAGYAVLNRVLVRRFSTFEITYYLMLVGALVFTTASVGQHAVQGTFSGLFTPLSDATFVTAILYLSLFSSLLTTIFASLALQRLTSAGLTIFLNLSTVVAILVGHFRLGETIHGYHLLGAAMILLGVIGTNAFVSAKH